MWDAGFDIVTLAEFKKAGHWPTLVAAFVYFDVSFCVWCLLGPLANVIADDLALGATAKGILVATPLLGGALLRIVMGGLSDHLGPRRAGLLGISLTVVPLLLGWLVVDTFPGLLVVALLLGIPGASFAVALPLASRAYPARHQGLALGIAGAGNSGTVLAALAMPRLAATFGWHGAIGLAIIPMLGAGLVFWLYAQDTPMQPPRLREYARVLGQLDTLWLCLFYGITFGGFVGLASFLAIFFRDQYAVGTVAAGDLTALCVFAGSFMRPVGGRLADRYGGMRVLALVYGMVAMILLGLALLPPLWLAIPLFAFALALLGVGNGSVFQLVPLRFPRELGVATGLIGAAGGLVGFSLPAMLGLVRDATGQYKGGLVAFAIVALWGLTLALAVSAGWRLTWAGDRGPAYASERSRVGRRREAAA